MSAPRCLVLSIAILFCANFRGAAQTRPLTDLYDDPLPAGAIGRLGNLRLRHDQSVNELAFLPDGKSLLSINDPWWDKPSVRLWEISSGRLLSQFALDADLACRPIPSPDRRHIATAGPNGISVYDLRSGEPVRRFGEAVHDRHGEWRKFAYVCNGTMLALERDKGRVELWDIAAAKKVGMIKPLRRSENPLTLKTLLPSPDGNLVAVTVAGGGGPDITIWALPDRKKLFTLPSWSNRLVFSPDSQILAQLSINSRRVFLCDARTGKEIHDLEPKGKISGVTFTSDSKTLVLALETGDIQSFDLPGCTETVAPPIKVRPGAALEFSKDGRSLLSHISYTFPQVWAWPGGNELLDENKLPSGPGCCLSPQGKTLAIATGNTVRLWDLSTGRELHAENGHEGPVRCLAVSADGKSVATAGENIRLWDVNLRKQRSAWDPHERPHDIALSADGKTVLCASSQGPLWSQWEADSGRPLRVSEIRPADRTPSISPDGRSIASSCFNGTVWLFDIASDKELFPVQQISADQSVMLPPIVSPDGRRILCIERTDDGEVTTAWDLLARSKLPRLVSVPDHAQNWAFAADSRTLVGVTPAQPVDAIRAESAVVFLDVSTGRHIVTATLPGKVACLAPSPDGHYLAAGFGDGTILLLSAATGKPYHRFDGHQGAVNVIRYSPDGKTLYSASDDTTVLMWDVSRIAPKPVPCSNLDACWADLAEFDVGTAYQAMWALTSVPKEAVPFLAGRLKPVTLPDEKTLRQWIVELDSDDFETRQAAMRALTAQGERIAPVLKQALKERVSLEASRRIEQLLAATEWQLPADELRQIRAIQALELMATPEARALLETLTKGSLGARQTREARESLDRLAKRPVP